MTGLVKVEAGGSVGESVGEEVVVVAVGWGERKAAGGGAGSGHETFFTETDAIESRFCFCWKPRTSNSQMSTGALLAQDEERGGSMPMAPKKSTMSSSSEEADVFGSSPEREW